MKVLSLFNGIGIGATALKNIGVEVEAHYISEIDKFANQTNYKHHPDSIQLGDITKWFEWNIPWGEIDIVTAGFPCQAWSMAGQQLGDKDPRGALFWTTLDVIREVLHYNPKAKWVMENVRMKQEFEEYITFHTRQALGHVEKTLINSALVTAQNRQRYYWTNFKVSQPEDRGILLKDILEDEPLPKPENLDDLLAKGVVEADQDLTGESQSRGRAIRNFKGGQEKGNSLTANAYKGMQTNGMTNILVHRPCEVIKEDISKGHVANATDIKGQESLKRVYGRYGKAPTLTTMQGGHRQPKIITFVDRDKAHCIDANYFKGGNLKSYFEKSRRQLVFCGAMRGRYLVDGVGQDSKGSVAGKTTQRIEVRYDGKTNTITTVQKDNFVCYPEDSSKKHYSVGEIMYRKLTPLECERLQGYPDNYTAGVSNTQRYKQIGNGWTLPVIEHIFKDMLKGME